MGKHFGNKSSVVKILSTNNKPTINLIISILTQRGVKARYVETFGEYALEIKFQDLEKAIYIAAYIIEKKNLEVNCWSAPYWKQFAPEFWKSRNVDDISVD